MEQRRIRSRARHAISVALLPVPVLALGLGQLQVKSGSGQPLLAEIAIISSDPTELQGLQARLAAPETFRRVGLEPPQGIVSDLQFTPAIDERGRPVIRVTSRAPVQQAGLSFLVEVDWGQGRLVREYSALVDAPRTVAAPATPPVQAPVLEVAPVIQRPATSPAAQADSVPMAAARPESAPSRPAPAPAGAAMPAQAPPSPMPKPKPAPIPAQRAPASLPATNRSVAPAATARAPAAYGPVKRGQALSTIATRLAGVEGYSLDQTMLALLRTNPGAFIDEDINRLREGAVLRIPEVAELSRYSASQAAALVREQIASWRQQQRAQAQPAAVVPATDVKPSAARIRTPASAASAPQLAQARLAIAPPGASSTTPAGTQSGISAGGEGEMLKQELQQTRESLAARDAEIQELKTRVAELERLQKDQQSLITMKDNALAGVQQTLGASNAGSATAPATQTGFSWGWSLLLLLGVAAIAWWFGRWRGAASASAPRGARLSDRSPVGAESTQPKASGGVAPVEETDTATRAIQQPVAEQSAPPPPAASAPAAPLWVGKARSTVPASPPASAPRTGASAVPAWVGGAPGSAVSSTPPRPAPTRGDRIELARAYLDLGDRTTARSLLQEVVAGGDPAAREEAARLLRSLA